MMSAGPDAGPKGRRILIRRYHVHLVVLLLDQHAHAVVAAMLVFAHLGVGLGIVEVRVRVQHAQHAGNRPVIDGQVGLVAVDRLGVVLLHQRIHVGEGFQAVAKLAFISRRLGSHLALQNAAHNGADGKKENHGKHCAAGAGSHMQKEPPDGGCGRLPGANFQVVESRSATKSGAVPR